jgi:hypothetical protein
MNPNYYLSKLMAEAHVEDLRRAADRSALQRTAKGASPPPAGSLELPITIRPARPTDASALARLAELDSAAALKLPAVIAEVAGEVRAAVSLSDGAAIADPFNHSAGMVQLLHARAEQLRGQHEVQPRHFFRLLRRRRRWAM